MPVQRERYTELERFVGPSRYPEKDEKRLYTHPLDELDTLNHYAFKGRRDMVRRFLVLTVNDHSAGDETIFLAAQLAHTGSFVVHFDHCEEAIEYVRLRSERLGVDRQIRFFSGSLEELFESYRRNPVYQNESGNGPFDYVRCTSGLNDRTDFNTAFSLLLSLLREDGTLGMSCSGHYAREPYRQIRQLGLYLNEDQPGLDEELARLKELFLFLPEENWARRLHDHLDPAVRTMRDDAFINYFLREDRHQFKVKNLYDLLDKNGLNHVNYSRRTRMYYEPWFAHSDPELAESMSRLSPIQREALSEIAWCLPEKHEFWASRSADTKANPYDLDYIPFFNPMAGRNWKEALLCADAEMVPELVVELNVQDRYVIPLPWGEVIRSFVLKIDGFKTLGEIITLLREECREPIGIEQIASECLHFFRAVEREDMILLRHRDTPVLPMTARRLSAGIERKGVPCNLNIAET